MDRPYSKGDQPIKDFRLVKFLGRGGFGDVWEAVTSGGTHVALKIINLEDKGGFKELRAVKMVKGIRHANLTPILAYWLKDAAGHTLEEGEEDDSVVVKAKAAELIIEMGLGDKNLLDRLRECRKQGQTGISPDELLDYIEQAARAIDYLNRPTHDLGSGPVAIQHCDIKPQNILLVGDAVQVCDFGLARILGEEARATLSGNNMSVPYTSPELIQDCTRPSSSSDQYSLAISYIELRTGALPFDSQAPASMIYSITQGKLALSKLPPDEQKVIRRATGLEPSRRFPTTLEMARELRRAYQGVSSQPSSVHKSGPIDVLKAGMEVVPGYKLVRPLGRGGYGTVWEARGPGGLAVALKIIRDLDQVTGQQEFKALELIKGLEHNHLLELHAYWLLDAEGGVIADEVRGQPGAPPAATLVICTKLASKNLLQRMAECQQANAVGIPPEELLRYMREAALAIDFLNESQHHLGGQQVSIQHRDVKPENILLARDGTVKVGDFGLARVLAGTSAEVHGNSVGFTPLYAAPEVFRNEITRWTDQYALAITYYKLRTGHSPIAGSSANEVMLAHTEGRLDLSYLPETEQAVVKRATSVVPEQRYPTCLELVTALEQALRAGFPVEAPSDEKPRPAPVKPSGRTVRPKTTPRPAPAQLAPTLAPAAESPWRTVSPGGRSKAEVVVEPDIQETRPGPGLPPDTDSGMPAPEKDQANRKKAWRAKAGAATQAPPPQTGAGGVPSVEVAVQVTGAHKPVKVSVYVTVIGLMVACTIGVVAACIIFLPPGPPKPATTEISSTGPSTPEGTKPPTRPEPTSRPAATTRRDTSPDPSSLADARIQTGEAKLRGGEPGGALQDFEDALSQLKTIPQKPPELWQRARLGAARAWARKGSWEKTRHLLSEIPNGDPGRDGPKHALDLLAQLEMLKPSWEKVLAQLDGLKKTNGLAAFGPQEWQWERDEADRLGKEAATDLVNETINPVVNNSPSQLEKLGDALSLAKRIAAFDPAYSQVETQSRGRATRHLREAAGKLRQPFDPAKPLDPPYKPADAAQAFVWLNKAREINGKTLPDKLGEDLALAIFYNPRRTDSELLQAATLLEDFKPTKGAENIPFLIVKGETEPLGASEAAFKCYEQVLKLLDDGNLLVSSQVLDRQVLTKALQRGEEACKGPVDQAFKARLAAVYDRKARDLKVHQGKEKRPWPEPQRELIALWKRARDLNPQGDFGSAVALECLDLSKEARSRAAEAKVAQEKKGLLNEAVAQAEEAAKADAKNAAEAYLAKGLALEELDRCAEAIEAFSAAAAAKEPPFGSLAGRGRCRCRVAVYEKNLKDKELRAALGEARQDLEREAGGELPLAPKLEALAWLGWCQFQLQPEKDLARQGKVNQEAQKSLTELSSRATAGEVPERARQPVIGALYDWGKYNLTCADLNPDKGDPYLKLATEAFVAVGQIAERGKDENTQHYAALRLKQVGVQYLKKPQPAPVQALQVFDRALPLAPRSEDKLGLMNERNLLLTSEEYRSALEAADRIPTKPKLLENAKEAVNLVDNEPALSPEIKAAALVGAARCYYYYKEMDDAVKLVDRALGFKLSDATKKKYQALKDIILQGREKK